MCLQAIAFNEIQESRHEGLLQKFIDLAKRLAGGFGEVPLTEVAIEISVCASFLRIDADRLRVQVISLPLRMAHHVKNFVHVQTNPPYSYSTSKTIENARRKQLHSDPSRLYC